MSELSREQIEQLRETALRGGHSYTEAIPIDSFNALCNQAARATEPGFVRVPDTSRVIVGKMNFMRSKRLGKDTCICCPDSKTLGHIFARYVHVEPHRGEWSGTEVNNIADAVREACNTLARDGDTLRVTVELLTAAPPASQAGESKEGK